jgi:selenocysteine lyase/cysteine desulfurase
VVSRRYWARAVHALDQLVRSPCADAIVFVENATAAVNTVLNSHVWNNIVCFDVTYAAVKKAVLHQVQSKRATHMEILGFIEREDKSLDLSKQALLTQIEQTCCRLQSQGVNLLIVDHISSCPAFVYPVRDIVKVARKSGFLVLIDGAHAVGQVDINLAEIDCDFYCSNLHKWFFAPKSSAFLYVKPEHQAKTLPLFISHEFGSGSFQKQFYMVGTRDYIPYFTIHASIDFIDNVIGGFDVLKRKNSKLMADAIELFKLKWKTDPISPILNYCSSDDDSDSPTLLCAPFLLTIELPFSYADYVKVFSESFASPMKFESKLEEELVQMTSHEGLNLMQHLYQKYRIQTITFHGRSKFWARISVQIYNSISDYEALAQAILDIKKQIDQALSK